MIKEYILVKKSRKLSGTINISGAKNSCLVIMASLILTSGKSILHNVPFLEDVLNMIALLRSLGIEILEDKENKKLAIDTSNLNSFSVRPEIMEKMRASVLVAGPLLARFKKAYLSMPGGCIIGSRPIDLHLAAFAKMGVNIHFLGNLLELTVDFISLKSGKIIFDYPTVGGTENIIMAAVLTPGLTQIINCSLEPEVFDLINILKKMGAKISIEAPATIKIEGVSTLNPVEYTIMPDRLEAGSLLLATAITGGEIYIPNIKASYLDIVLEKLSDMGHMLSINSNGLGINLKAIDTPKAINLKTMPYPGFPTDLQAPMIAVLSVANGTSVVSETVFENRLLHVHDLNKMGADIKINNNTATIKGVSQLKGNTVNATDIRAACSLVIAGLKADGETRIIGTHHLYRGYQGLDQKLNSLGAQILITSSDLT